MGSQKQNEKPVYFDGSGLKHVVFNDKSEKYKEFVIKPEGAKGEIQFPYFPYAAGTVSS